MNYAIATIFTLVAGIAHADLASDLRANSWTAEVAAPNGTMVTMTQTFKEASILNQITCHMQDMGQPLDLIVEVEGAIAYNEAEQSVEFLEDKSVVVKDPASSKWCAANLEKGISKIQFPAKDEMLMDGRLYKAVK